MNIENIQKRLKIGEGHCITKEENIIYGRITGDDLTSPSTIVDGATIHSAVYFTTPCGSTVLCGSVYIEKLDKDGISKLLDLEATCKKEILYDGIIIKNGDDWVLPE